MERGVKTLFGYIVKHPYWILIFYFAWRSNFIVKKTNYEFLDFISVDTEQDNLKKGHKIN